MSWLTYKDDDLKGHDIMTLHFINNEKLLLLHERSGGEQDPGRLTARADRAQHRGGKQTDGKHVVKQTNHL